MSWSNRSNEQLIYMNFQSRCSSESAYSRIPRCTQDRRDMLVVEGRGVEIEIEKSTSTCVPGTLRYTQNGRADLVPGDGCGRAVVAGTRAVQTGSERWQPVVTASYPQLQDSNDKGKPGPSPGRQEWRKMRDDLFPAFWSLRAPLCSHLYSSFLLSSCEHSIYYYCYTTLLRTLLTPPTFGTQQHRYSSSPCASPPGPTALLQAVDCPARPLPPP